VGVIQHVQVCRAADGAEHGMRARGAAYSGEHALARTHLHTVGDGDLAVQALTGRQDDCGVPGQTAASVREVVGPESPRTSRPSGRDAGCCDVARVGCVELLYRKRVGVSLFIQTPC
jgi:hypothetical protein